MEAKKTQILEEVGYIISDPEKIVLVESLTANAIILLMDIDADLEILSSFLNSRNLLSEDDFIYKIRHILIFGLIDKGSDMARDLDALYDEFADSLSFDYPPESIQLGFSSNITEKGFLGNLDILENSSLAPMDENNKSIGFCTRMGMEVLGARINESGVSEVLISHYQSRLTLNKDRVGYHSEENIFPSDEYKIPSMIKVFNLHINSRGDSREVFFTIDDPFSPGDFLDIIIGYASPGYLPS